MYRIENLNILDWCKFYQGEPFHALLCDPPYHLTSVKRLSGSTEEKEPETLNDDKLKQSGAARFFKSQKGFMGKTWDGGSISFDPDTWRALAEHLHDGAFLMAFASSRGWHRQAVAMEDAGLIMHPSIFLWVQGMGFPKASRIDDKIDKRKDYSIEKINEFAHLIKEKRIHLGISKFDADNFICNGSTMYSFFEGRNGYPLYFPNREHYSKIKELFKLDNTFDIFAYETNLKIKKTQKGNFGYQVYSERWRKNTNKSKATTDLAKAWVGHRYGKQCLKPACEVLLIATKPLTNEPIYDIIIITLTLEMLLCLFYNVQDAEKATKVLHQNLYRVVDNFVLGNAGRQELLKDVHFVKKNSGLNQATMGNFVQGNALTKEETLNLLNAIQIGRAEVLSQWATDMSGEIIPILQNIEKYWNEILVENYQIMNKSIISTKIDLITDLKICASLLYQNILANIIQPKELIGKMLFVKNVESLLASLATKLLLLKNTIVIKNVTEMLVKQENDQEENLKDGGEINPILVFQKPYSSKPVDSIVRTGAGALNINKARIGNETWEHKKSSISPYGSERIWDTKGNTPDIDRKGQGRFPSNFIISHTPECVRVGEKKVTVNSHYPDMNVNGFGKNYGGKSEYIAEGERVKKETISDWICVPECPVRRLNEQTGILKSGARKQTLQKDGIFNRVNIKFQYQTACNASEGTASRFFHNSDFTLEQIENADPVIYQAKAAVSEREQGLYGIIPCNKCGGMDSFYHVKIEGKDEYIEQSDRVKANKKEIETRKLIECRRNPHPTIKPLSLNKYLCSLLFPPPEYAPRRILIPFSGSGSEMIGALLSGFEEIVGIELDPEYCKIAEARLAYWQNKIPKLEQVELFTER